MKYKKTFAIITILLIILVVIFTKDDKAKNIEIKTNKESIYELVKKK